MILFFVEMILLLLITRIKNKYFFMYYNKLVKCDSVKTNFNYDNCLNLDNMGSIIFYFLKNNVFGKEKVILRVELYYFVAGVLMTTFTFYITKLIKYLLKIDFSNLKKKLIIKC